MAAIENAKGQKRIVRCPAFRKPEESGGLAGCDHEFRLHGLVGQRRSAHIEKHDPEDFGLTPLEDDEKGRRVRTPVGGD